MEGNRILCIEGELKGAEIRLEPEEMIIVGREPRFSNLVFRDLSISRKHCYIELDKQGNYYVTDYSECGIVTGEGKRLERFNRVKCKKGTVLQIGRAGTKIVLE